MFEKHVQILVFHFINKENWLMGTTKERAELPCHFMATHGSQVISLLKGKSGQNVNVCISCSLLDSLLSLLFFVDEVLCADSFITVICDYDVFPLLL